MPDPEKDNTEREQIGEQKKPVEIDEWGLAIRQVTEELQQQQMVDPSIKPEYMSRMVLLQIAKNRGLVDATMGLIIDLIPIHQVFADNREPWTHYYLSLEGQVALENYNTLDADLPHL